MMEEKVFSGHQPNFLPYLGYFYKMYNSDVFVIDDDVQYSSEGYQNFNFIKVQGNKHKVTVPVSYEFGDEINKVKISYSNDRWISKLLTTLKMNYGKSPYYKEVYEYIEALLNQKNEYLCDMNAKFIKDVADKMGIHTNVVIASKDLNVEGHSNQRNVAQCLKANCNVYLSGVGGKNYNDEAMYRANGIKVKYSEYEPFVYKQQGRGFIENLSVLDYLFNEGFNIPKEWK